MLTQHKLSECVQFMTASHIQVFGKAFTVAGFPPWLLRFCELYHLGQLRDVTDERLDTTLQQYNNVAQRFGT